MANLFWSAVVLGMTVAGIILIVHPPTGRDVARRFGVALLALLAANTALSYLWSEWTGRLVLVVLILLLIGKGERGR
jgi:glycerol uptake facilitator-like aquaporin